MRIVIAVSGTGGHIFPALSLAQKLNQEDLQIYFVCDKTRIESKIAEKGFPLLSLSVTKIKFNSPVYFFQATVKLIKSFFESSRILKKIKPQAVIGFGGYTSFPMVVCAWFNKIPIILHEQNVIPGRANRILSLFAKKVTVSFNQTNKYFKFKKVIYTGCPVREELSGLKKEEALKEFNLKPDKFTILVMGGSQGSHRINQEFVEAVSTMAMKDMSQIQIIHLTGMNDFACVEKAYNKTTISAYCVAFLEKMGYAYNIADLVISRAGGSSLAEIINFRIPSVLIPYPFAYHHQMANACVLEKNGAAIIIEEKYLSGKKLKENLLQFLNNRERLKVMKESFLELGVKDAAESLTQEVLSLLKI